MSLPHPPLALRNRVGDLSAVDDELAAYEQIGRDSLDRLIEMLPRDWSPAGRRVLDFGCGAGRTLRHVIDAWPTAELWGCDVDRASIEWLRQHAEDRLTLLEVADQPGIDVPTGHFDLVYAFSVFTHLSLHWAGWMAELHRALAPDGLLFATFLAPSFAQEVIQESWEEDATGMTVLRAGTPWDEGGPVAFVSEWWLRAHWGRAFEIVSLQAGSSSSQGAVLMRKKALEISAPNLERPEPGEPRELDAALAAQTAVIRDDIRWRRWIQGQLLAAQTDLEARRAEIERLDVRCRALESELSARQEQLETIYRSRSWRLTAPLRSLLSERRRP